VPKVRRCQSKRCQIATKCLGAGFYPDLTGTLAPWHSGTLALLAPWHIRTLAPSAPWYPGTFSTFAPSHQRTLALDLFQYQCAPAVIKGCDELPEQIGLSAVDLLTGMILRGEKGVPAVPSAVQLQGRWVAGRSCPRRDTPSAPPALARGHGALVHRDSGLR